MLNLIANSEFTQEFVSAMFSRFCVNTCTPDNDVVWVYWTWFAISDVSNAGSSINSAHKLIRVIPLKVRVDSKYAVRLGISIRNHKLTTWSRKGCYSLNQTMAYFLAACAESITCQRLCHLSSVFYATAPYGGATRKRFFAPAHPFCGKWGRSPTHFVDDVRARFFMTRWQNGACNF